MANETQVSCGIAFNDVIGYITIKKVSENAIILCEKKYVIHCHDAALCIFCCCYSSIYLCHQFFVIDALLTQRQNNTETN